MGKDQAQCYTFPCPSVTLIPKYMSLSPTFGMPTSSVLPTASKLTGYHGYVLISAVLPLEALVRYNT